MELTYQRRDGLFPEHASVEQGPHERVRLTIPAREALQRAGASITPEPADGGHQIYTVALGNTVPEGVVAVRIVGTDHLALRMDIEPEYPGEIGTLWEQADFSPCPVCGAPLVWYEAGYVPGYRVCARPPHHHVLVE
jgi:hypothetical protein